MKTVQGFKLRAIGTDHVLTPESTELINFNKMIAMNSSAAFLWDKVDGTEFDASTIADLLLEEYGISRETAQTDAEKVIRDWLDAGIICE